MRPLAATLLYLAFVFIGAALLAPWIYHGLHLAAMEYPNLRPMAESPFHRYLNRCLIGLALLGLWPFLRALEMRSAQQLGFHSNQPARELGIGLVWSLAIVTVLASIAILSGAHLLTLSDLNWPKHLRNALPPMIVVPVIEEILFRAGLFGALRKRGTFWTAAILSSAIYALVHFFARPEYPSQVHWHSGLVVLGQMLHGFTEWRLLLPAFINLLLIGLILAVAFEQTGAIYMSIGLHAGFIFAAKTFPFITSPSPKASQWIWGSDKLIDGWAACLFLLVMFFLFKRRGRNSSQEPVA
jgi:uncharacterized protein